MSGSEIFQRIQFQPLGVDHRLEVAQPLIGPDGVVGFRDAKASVGIVGGDNLVAAGKVAGQMGDNMGAACLFGKAQIFRRQQRPVEAEAEFHSIGSFCWVIKVLGDWVMR